MSIDHQCDCGNRIVLPDSAAGKKARCRKCGLIFTIATPNIDVPVTLAYAKSVPETSLSDAIVSPPHGFFGQLAYSFVLPFIRGNLGILIPLAIAAIVVLWIPFLSYLLNMMLSAYFAAICLETITHTASGEQDFPNVWIHNWWDDLLVPALQFIGSWLIVLAPMILLKVAVASGWLTISDRVVQVAGFCGLLLWPATVLAIALGNSLSAARPDLVIRTALAAPLAYLALCLGVFIAGAATFLPEIRTPFGATSGTVLAFVEHLLAPALGVYTLLVISRIVGLYYLYFKNRIPWQAE